MRQEAVSLSASADELRGTPDFGDKPIIVLTSGRFLDAWDVPGVSQTEKDEFQRVWQSDLQVRLTRLSTSARQTILPDSTHMIPYDRPERVAEAVREVWDAVNKLAATSR